MIMTFDGRTKTGEENLTLESFIGDLPCGILMFTAERFPKLTYMNDCMMDILRVSPESEDALEFIRENIYFMFPFSQRDKVKETLGTVAATGVPAELETIVFSCDGKERPVIAWIGKRDLETDIEYKAIFFALEHKLDKGLGSDKPVASKPCPETRGAPEKSTGKEVYIRAFGYFDVFVDGEPIAFKSYKAKEFLALLVDRRGGYVSAREAISYLWEDEAADEKTLSRLRKVVMRLREELKIYGIEDIVVSVRGKRRIDMSKVSCDFYDFLNEVPGSENLYRGFYMTNYSWGEMTAAELDGICYEEEK